MGWNPFCNYNLSIDWTENQISSDSDYSHSDDNWGLFKNSGMHFTHLNVNKLWPRIQEIRHVAQLKNGSGTGINETKIDESFLNSEIVIVGYDLIRLDRARKGGSVCCFIEHSVAYSCKPNMCINTGSTFTKIYLPKLKPFIEDRLCRPPDKIDLIV